MDKVLFKNYSGMPTNDQNKNVLKVNHVRVKQK